MDLRESVQCPECGTWGWTGSKCTLCAFSHGKSLGQHMQKGMGETSDDISSAASRMAHGTKQAAGEVVDVIGGGIATDAKSGLALGATGVFTAFALGGFWVGMSTLLGGYIGLIGAPSLLALFIEAKLLVILCSAIFGVLGGGVIGMVLALHAGVALRERNKSCIWLFIPLALAATLLTVRLPDAFSAWWNSTAPWW